MDLFHIFIYVFILDQFVRAPFHTISQVFLSLFATIGKMGVPAGQTIEHNFLFLSVSFLKPGLPAVCIYSRRNLIKRRLENKFKQVQFFKYKMKNKMNLVCFQSHKWQRAANSTCFKSQPLALGSLGHMLEDITRR